jgi:hypothetical protein
MKANTNKGIIGKPKKTASSTYERTPWCGNFSEEELDRPGGLLLAALIKCANDRRLLFKDMAKELGVTYGYINQLRNGRRLARLLTSDFSVACSNFLNVPRMTVLMLAGAITPADVFESDALMASEISRGIGFICEDMHWGHLVTPELRRADAITQFGVVRMYEAATGKVLMDKALDCHSLATQLAKLKEIEANRGNIVLQHSLKKTASISKRSSSGSRVIESNFPEMVNMADE